MSNALNAKYKYSRGAALLLMIIFFMIASLIVVLSIGRTSYHDIHRTGTLIQSTQAYYVSESGIEDVVHRLRKGKAVAMPGTEVLTFAGATATTTVLQGFNSIQIQTEATKNNLFRAHRVELVLGGGASFNFGLQATGRITMANSSQVVGNVYSNGDVTGAGGNMIYGDVVSAGSGGFISGVHSTSSAYAHTIQSSTIDGNAYYQSISGTSVGGTLFPGSPDQPTSTLPLSDTLINDWKVKAEAGGVISAPCPGGVYTISADVSLGPKKILCDVEIDQASTDVTITGPLWIVGTLTTKNGPNIIADPSASGESAIIIADKASDPINSSTMTLNQSTGFIGAGAGSYILMIAMNTSASVGGAVTAIDAGNRTTSGQREVIYYAPYGKIAAANSVKLRGATAHTIALSQSASVEYETGMISLLFSGGPSGGYGIDSWAEVE